MQRNVRILVGWIMITVLATGSLQSQTPPKQAKSNKGKEVDRVIVTAEREWPSFLGRLKAAFTNVDDLAVRNLMAKDARCGSWVEDSNADGDLRDECIADWKIRSEYNLSGIRWAEVVRFLSNSPCKIEKVKKDGSFLSYYGGYGRGINSEGECKYFESYFAYFVFFGGRWLLVDLGEHESE